MRAALIALFAATPAQAAWAPPVDAPVTRRFDLGADPFEAGRHRGADFDASAGAPVRAVCGGRVAFAGPAGTNGRVVTVRCGRWRVTHLPLATVAVAAQARVDAGDLVGTVAASRAHMGVHVGVRRAGDAFGYVDPMRFIRAAQTPPVVPRVGPSPRGPVPRGAVPRVAVPRAAMPPASVPRGAVPRVAPAEPGVPAAAWGGVAAVLAGLGGGLGWLPRRRRGRRAVARKEVPSAV